MTEYRRLTVRSIFRLVKLKVSKLQRDLVAPNAITIAQSLFEKGSEIYGIWIEDTAIGLIALIDLGQPGQKLEAHEDPDSIYIWRMMVAEHHQGKGHGIDALRFIERRCRQIGRRRIILSAVDGAGAAIPFYEKQGYKKTGNIVDGEIEMAKLIKQS